MSKKRQSKPEVTRLLPPRLNLVRQELEGSGADVPPQDDSQSATPGNETPEADQGPATAAVAITEAASASPAATVNGAEASNVMSLPSADRREKLRIIEALLFAASEPLAEKKLAEHLQDEDDVTALLVELQGFYASRGINLVRVAGKWAFRTADDLSFLLERHAKEERRLSKAAMETLAIIAYHQPSTRAEIEEVRGVQTSAGTLDALMETGWVRPRGRRRAPGRPLTYGTTPEFLEHFGLDGIKDLPGLGDLKSAGLLDSNLPPDFSVPEPRDLAALMPDELPLEDEDEEEPAAELPFGASRSDDEEPREREPEEHGPA